MLSLVANDVVGRAIYGLSLREVPCAERPGIPSSRVAPGRGNIAHDTLPAAN
jgi:hypothetical protein